jgi:hypothetical protein
MIPLILQPQQYPEKITKYQPSKEYKERLGYTDEQDEQLVVSR